VRGEAVDEATGESEEAVDEVVSVSISNPMG
jgi:hypothetical protein